MISVAEAIAIIRAQTHALESESVALADALSRVLAADIVADSDLPPFDRAQMDGYAVRANDTADAPTRLRVVGEAAAGRGFRGALGAGEAVRIMTGAPVPNGANAVEQVEMTNAGADDSVEFTRAVTAGQFIVARANEIKAQSAVLFAGERINAAMMAVLAAFGYAEVSVARRPRAAIIATGSELVPVTKHPDTDQIRDSNTYSLAAYAQLAGAQVERQPLAEDDLESLAARIAACATRTDVIILSGGVSMGVYDYTKAALHALGAEIFFERVALRPGKPTVFARLGRALIFGLPGNPVSVAVTFNLFARTAIQLMQGLRRDTTLALASAILTHKVKGSAARASYLPAELSTDDKGHLLATPLRWGGSSDFVAFARTEALIIVPSDVASLESGALVSIAYLPS